MSRAALDPAPRIEFSYVVLIFLVFVSHAGTSMSPIKREKTPHSLFLLDDSQRENETPFFGSFVFFASKSFCFFFVSRHSLHPSSPITLKNGGGNERFNERNGAIDPPFILMGHRSQSITGLLILLLKGEGGGQGEVGRGREGVWQVC